MLSENSPDPRAARTDAERRGETHLRRDDLYRLLVESTRDYAIFVLDSTGHVASWNPGGERIKGYTADEIVGQPYEVFFTDEAREAGEPAAMLERAVRDGRVDVEDWRCRKDGTRFWAHVVLTALYQGDELVGFGKVTADLTVERTAREELARRERQLAEAQQIAHLGSWEFERATGRLSWSDELFRIFGLPPAEPIHYETYLEMLHPEDRDDVRRKVETSLEDGSPYVHQHRIVRPDGEERWVQSRGEVTWNEEQDSPRLAGTTLDITGIKEAEDRARRLSAEQVAREAAERTAQRMGFLAEASALLGASLEYDDTLKTVAWMAVPTFADWCAVDIVDPVGQLERLAVAHLDPAGVELAEWLHERYPPDPDSGTGTYAVVRSGEAELHEEVTPELLERSAMDPEHLEILKELGLTSAMVVPIQIRDRALGALTFVYSDSGRRYGQDDLVVAQELANRAALAVENSQLHTAERDARRHAERATERTMRLQTITGELSEAVTPDAVAQVMVEQGTAALEAAEGALAMVQEDGSLTMMRSTGLPDEVVSHYARFTRDAEIPLAEAVRTEKLVIVEDISDRDARYPEIAAVRQTTGTSSLVAVPLRSGEGVIGSLGFGYREQRPFTEDDQRFLLALGRQCAQALERAWLYETEHEAREVAEAASRAKSQFVAMMSHELRTPLSAIIGYQELLTEEISGPINDAQRQQLDRIQSSAAHLRDLINQILSLSRIEAGKEEVEAEEVNVARMTREVALLMQQKAEARGLTLELDLPEELYTRTDAGKIRQVLLNLLSNAIKFTSEGGVTVALRSDQDAIRLSVTDTGAGIAPEERERIFDAFTQVDQSMTRSVGGSGLGLAVSQRLARLLEGELELKSEPGRGSTFTLRLPRNPV